jgi:predicted Zn-dependent protease with MMP-like domain
VSWPPTLVNLPDMAYLSRSAAAERDVEGRPMTSGPKWHEATAPSLADIELLAEAAWERLPNHFRQLCRNLLIRVEDFPTDDVLKSLDIENPFDLMGLYQGVSLDKKSVTDLPREPDMVFLYRRPILDYWAESEEPLGHLVTHILVHEVGHHFGFSDADMEAIEGEAGV